MESKCSDETAHVQVFVNPHILRMREGSVSFHYILVYIFGSFVITEPIPGFSKIYMRVTDEA